MPFMVEAAKSQNWFIKVFDTHYEYIRNYIYYLSGDIGIAEDLAQDVFMKVWERREGINEETIKPLLYKIARNLYFNLYKRNTLDLKFMNSALRENENESPEYLMEIKEFDERLQLALSELPEHCRTIFLMSRMDDLKYHEIAERFDISVKAVEKQISKALKLLREKIEFKM
jgi:RNA polymerase sigma-70 factor (family 1)